MRQADADAAERGLDAPRDSADEIPRFLNRVGDAVLDLVESVCHRGAKTWETQLVADGVARVDGVGLRVLHLGRDVVPDEIERVRRLGLRGIPIAVHGRLQGASSRGADLLPCLQVV